MLNVCLFQLRQLVVVFQFTHLLHQLCVTVGITNTSVEKKLCNHCRDQKVSVSYKIKQKKHEKIDLLGKDKLNIIEVSISKALIDSYISYDEFVSVNNVLRQYNQMEEEKYKCVGCKKINTI